MLRYQQKYNQYFVEYFRNSSKYQNRNVLPSSRAKRKISVVTTCMNRLHDLQLTLPKNIEDSGDYPVEFVLLNYNSTDGLDNWVASNLSHFIESKKLVYYKAINQKYFCPNHSRNVTFRLASSDIITNVDSDNYIHAGFLERINECCDKKIVVVPQSFIDPKSDRLTLRGRFAMMKSDILQLRGFDEDLDQGYSHDDTSFIFRAILNGFYLSRFEDKFLNQRIETKMKDRSKNMKNTDYFESQEKNIRNITDKLFRAEIIANKNRGWGNAILLKNFSEIIVLKGAPSN